MRPKLIFLCLLAASAACKKNADYPPELRPRDFFVRFTLLDENGAGRLYEYRGETDTTIGQPPGLTFTLSYFSNSAIRDSIRQITAGIAAPLLPAPFALRLNHPDKISDPFAVPEWTPSELDFLLVPGKVFSFGDGPGEAKLVINDYPDGNWSCSSNSQSNTDGFLRIVEVEDYGAPEIGVPYFGKKVRIAFNARVYDALGEPRALHGGEAVLFFRYYIY